MLLVLIFVLPGWLVKDYLVLEHHIPFKLDTSVEGVVTNDCEGLWSPEYNTCTKLNAWYASEVYMGNNTIAAWKNLTATKDSDYNETTLEELRCWMWNQNSSNSAAIKAMGGLAKCTTAGLIKAGAKNKKGILMTEWYPQDFVFGDPT